MAGSYEECKHTINWLSELEQAIEVLTPSIVGRSGVDEGLVDLEPGTASAIHRKSNLGYGHDHTPAIRYPKHQFRTIYVEIRTTGTGGEAGAIRTIS